MGVYIIGVGQLGFGERPDTTVRTMAVQAIKFALLDAGLAGGDMQSVFFCASTWDRLEDEGSLKGQVVMDAMGIENVPVVNVRSSAGGGSAAVNLAYTRIRQELMDVALVVGVDKVTRARARQEPAGQAPGKAACGVGSLVQWEAKMAIDHMERFGTTPMQLAGIAAKNRLHGSLNPWACRQKRMTAQEILADTPVTYPFTQAMCAFAADGGAAAVLCSGRILRKLGAPKPVRILASVLEQGRRADVTDAGRHAATQAWEIAGVPPADIDLAELHDTTSFAELRETEAMGFCQEGDGGAFAASGATTLGGRVPINTSGGLECRGAAPNASGLAQIHEVVTQLRGEAGLRQVPEAATGITQNKTGTDAGDETTCVHILEGSSSGRRAA